MSKQAKVSVILTSYNHAKYLRESIDSILNQTFSDFELIIVDDASTDESWQIINSYSDPRIQAFRSNFNTQAGGEIRRAISEVSVGEYIAIHHSDDVWEPQKLEKQVAFLDANLHIGAVFSRALIIDENGQPFRDETHFYSHIFDQPNRSRYEWLNYFFYHGNALCHPSAVVRKVCYEDCGVYRYGLAQLGDFDMWVRLCMKYEIHVLTEKLVRFRLRENETNVSGNRPEVHIRGEFEFLQIYQNYLSITDKNDFLKVFPDSAVLFEKEDYDIPFILATVAISLMNSFGRLFGLQLLFDIINDPEHAKKIERIYGFRNTDFVRLTAKHDIFSVFALSQQNLELQALFMQLFEKEQSLQALSIQLVEKEQSLQALSIQLVEKDRDLAEIRNSKTWKLALLFRRLRVMLAPPNSRRTWILRQVSNVFILPIRQFNWIRKLRKDLALIRSSSLFDANWYMENNLDVAEAQIEPARHYLLFGGFEGRDPGPDFCSDWYLNTYEDVKITGINPLVHYLKRGKEEGRVPCSPDIKFRVREVRQSNRIKTSNRPKKTSLKKIIRVVYFVNQRLPLSDATRQKLQQLVYKLLPAFFYNYKRTVNEIANESYSSPNSAGYRNQSAFFRNLVQKGEKTDLTIWSQLLRVNESTLGSLLVPPAWQVDKTEGFSNKYYQAKQATETDPLQVVFSILLFVNNAPAHYLNHCIRSVQEQTYENWKLEVCVREGELWNEAVLAIQFEDDPRIQVRNFPSREGIIQELEASVRDSTGEYILLLSPYDELKQDALHHAFNEIVNSESDLLYCPGNIPADITCRDFSDLRGGTEDIFVREISFSQFAIWKKTYLESLFPNGSISAIEDLIHMRNKFAGTCKPELVKMLSFPCHSFREIPGRKSITLTVNDGKFDLVASSIPLRILVDARLLGRQITGTERYILELLKELALLRNEYDFDLKAIALTEPKEKIEGVEFLTARHIEAIHNCHIFHKTFPASDGGTLAEMALAHSVIYSPLDLILYSNPDYFFSETDYYQFRKTMQLAVKLSNWIISISNYSKMEMELLLNAPGGNITPVHLGVRADHFSLEKQEDRGKLALLNIPSTYFLFIGTNYPHKNLVTLLRAFKLVRKRIPAANLVLVGTNHYDQPQPEMDNLLSEMSSNILQLGYVPDDVLPALYHYSCALVYPSLHEGFGLPLVEAMLCGAPVIASDSTSIPEVSGKEAAILVNGRDEWQIADAMIRIWDDPEVRNQLMLAGYKNAANFSWKNTARQTLKCYQNAINNSINDSPERRIKEKLGIINELGTHPPTILIATHIRFYPPAAGNEQRLLRLVKYLKKLGYQIVMLVNPFLETTKLDRQARSILHQYVDYYEEIGDIPGEEINDISLDPRIGNESILNKWKFTEESFCSDAVMQRAGGLIEQFSPKIILAEYIWMSRIFALAAPDTLKVIDTIDMFSRKKESVVKFGIHDTLAITPSEELAFINRSDVIIAIQDSEADAFKKLAPSCKIITAGIDFDVENLLEDANSEIQFPTLLIVGSGNQINVHCITEFLDQVWPRIHQQTSSCRLRIVGKVCNSLSTKDPSVELIPYIKDLDAMYRDATLVVNPVYAGTGIKVKSVEALGHGKAFVCWPEGAAGISSGSSDPFLVVHSWEELAESVLDLLNYPDKRQNLESAAREFAKSTLADKVIYRQVADCFDTFCKRELNVLCLFLRYGINDHPQGMPDLQDWYEGKMSGAKVTTWIIDNKIEGEVDGIDLLTGFRLLSGDNQQREFSAFQKVLTQHREEIETYDIVHFVTSAFNTLFTGYLDYFSLDQLELVAHRPIYLGHIDSYDEPVQLGGKSSQSWIRTCFFFMSPETIYSISNFVFFREEDHLFKADGNFLNESSLSENYKQYITGWLNGKAMQGVSWHSKIPDAGSFKGKALAILNEHMLSIQLREAGIHLVDYYWLKDNSHMLYSAIDYPVPDSLEQVKYRQEYLFGRAHRDRITT